jgi:hypothetical protein
MTAEIVFVVGEAPEGGYIGRAAEQSIFVEADTWVELEGQVRDAVACHFESGGSPKLIRLYFVREEVITA